MLKGNDLSVVLCEKLKKLRDKNLLWKKMDGKSNGTGQIYDQSKNKTDTIACASWFASSTYHPSKDSKMSFV